jgi:ArsR family transcriptional regulator
MPTATSLDIDALRRSAGAATSFLRILANEDRLLLLCQLTEGERCVSDLESLTGIGQPTLSQQLGVLRSEGLVKPRRDGKYVFYTLGDMRVLPMLDALHAMFCRELPRRRASGSN